MSEPAPKLKAALAQVQAPWDAARTESSLRGLAGRARARQRRALVASGGGALLALGLAFWLLRGPGAAPSAPLARLPVSPAAQDRALPAAQQLLLPDGSKLRLLAADSDVAVVESEPQRIALRVRAGRARFEVQPEAGRAFEVRTARVVFEVLGSVFEIDENVERTWLHVEAGQVVALLPDRRQVLEAGQEATFSAPLREPAVRALEGESGRKLATRARKSAAPSQAGSGWREHAERGDFKEAFPLLPEPDAIERMDVAELLLAADAARLSGHPRAALPFLTRVVERHADDARAPLAAFTLGGVLMNQLGMPHEAEAAYAKARATSLGGALAQDALARQVEAAHRAGDEAQARQLARDYLEHYPQGRRVRAVRRFGGL
jgi:transmembrane sensor